MKTKNIIKKLKSEHEHDLKFKYNYDVLSNEIAFETKTPLNIGYHAQTNKIFKYASLFLLVISLTLTGLLVYQLAKAPTVLPSQEALVFEYFENNNMDYIHSPIQTEIINEHIVNVYMGKSQTSQVIFVFTFINRLDDIDMNFSILGSYTAGDGLGEDRFKSVYFERLNSFIIQEIEIEAVYDVKVMYTMDSSSIEEFLELNIRQYLDYLNK